MTTPPDDLGSCTPATLLGPPGAFAGSPPVRTRAQVLPFHELTWEDFEKLCVRLVRTHADVAHVQLYGEAGQKQHGIDLYARVRSTENYRLYQCKRVEEFGPAAVRDAVQAFVDGRWLSRASDFIVCTSFAATRTETAEAIEEQAARLRQDGVEFDVWDAERLTTELKAHAAIVDDFFDRSWAEAACGRTEVDRLGDRLDGPSAAEYRVRLQNFFTALFIGQDPGLPLGSHDRPGRRIPLRERFVLPDLITATESASLSASEERQTRSPEAAGTETAGQSQPDRGGRRHVRGREKLTSWLRLHRRSLLLGAAGVGKTTVLRNIVLDLFSPGTPELPELFAEWSTLLPVWVSFAFWTKLIESSPAGAVRSLTA